MQDPDRKRVPAVNQVDLGDLPLVKEIKLSGEIPLYIIDAGSQDLVKVDFVFKAGQVWEKSPLQASTANMMLLEGSQNYGAEEMNRLIDFYGTFPSLFIEKDSAGLSIIFMNRHAKKIMALCREILFRPIFPENELNVLLNKRLQRYLVNREKVQVIAREGFFSSIFGKDHPYGNQVVKEDFGKVSADDLIGFHKTSYDVSNMAVIASGKVNAGLIRHLTESFCEIPPGSYLNVAFPGLSYQSPKKELIIKTDAVQSAIRVGSRTINKKHPDYHGLKIVNTILGGYFGSRLMKNIREDKGFTYGISSSVASLAQSGYMVISTEVGSQHTRATLDEIYKEIGLLHNYPVGNEELENVRGYMMGELVRMFDGPFSASDSFRSAWEFGFDNKYYIDFARKIKTITPDEIIHLAKTYYKIEELHEIIAGPE